RPAKVGSFFYHVDLITTSWTMLMHPDLARFGMPDHTLRVSMAIGVNGFFRIGLIYKRIVGRNAAVMMQAIHFSRVPGDVLWIVRVSSAVTDRERHIVTVKRNTGSKMYASLCIGRGLIKNF